MDSQFHTSSLKWAEVGIFNTTEISNSTNEGSSHPLFLPITQDNSAAHLAVELNPELLFDLQILATMTSKQDHVYGKVDILY